MKGDASHLLGVTFSDDEDGRYDPRKAKHQSIRLKDTLGHDYTQIVSDIVS